MLLWIQLKNCLEVMRKTSEETMKTEELTKRRMILEQQSSERDEKEIKTRASDEGTSRG